MLCLPGAIVLVVKSFLCKLRGSFIMNVRIKILHHVTAPHSSLKVGLSGLMIGML